MPRPTPLHLRGHTPQTLAEAVPGLPLAVARRVLHRVLGEDRDRLEGVPGLSKSLARELTRAGRLDRLEVLDRRRSAVDPFVKYLFRAGDGQVFEAVRIPLERPRYSICVSSQVGCALACAFCETGRLGLARQLEPWEMVEQVLTVRRESPERPVTGVVFQGQGEPLQNYDNVMQAARVLRDPCGPRIGADRITISTVGLLPQIERYTEEGHRYRLILSLSSAFSEKRARLVPLTARYGVPELAAAMRRHAERRGGPVSLAWVLISGFNTGADEAAELAHLFRGVPVRVSVIDVNDPSGRFQRPSDEERGLFLSALSQHGLGFVRRYSGGPDIHAACGMLASRAQGGALHAPPASAAS
ncbi:MAG TPA: radical SAM protein [Vicinamibacteria bacterium]|nr:radical SAM protein [Vicinamibacteria bacterium]